MSRTRSQVGLDPKFLIEHNRTTYTNSSFHQSRSRIDSKSPFRKGKRLPVIPSDPLKHYRGASMGPGAYTIDRDLLPKKPKTNMEKLKVGFNSKEIRFDFMEPKKEELVKVSKEQKIMESLEFNGKDKVIGRKNPKKKRILRKQPIENFPKEDRFKDNTVIPDKIKQPGPGAYDLKGFAAKDYSKNSAFFRSRLDRLNLEKPKRNRLIV